MEVGGQQVTMVSDAAAAEDAPAEEVPKETICFDFTKGKCNRSAAVCKFSHDPEVIARVNSREKGVCYDWQYGACTRGKLCRFSHSPQDLAEQQARQALKQQELDATGRKSSQLCYQFTGGKCTRPDCGFSHDRDAPKRGVTVRAASVEICFDYSRGKCSYGAACKYAHDPRLMAANVKPGIGPRVAQAADLSPPVIGPGFMPPQNPALMVHHPQMVPLHQAHLAAAQHQQQLMQHQQLLQAQLRLPAPVPFMSQAGSPYTAQQQMFFLPQHPGIAAAQGVLYSQVQPGSLYMQPRPPHAGPAFMQPGQPVFMQPAQRFPPAHLPAMPGRTRYESTVDQRSPVQLDNAASLPDRLEESPAHDVSLDRGETMSCPGLTEKSHGVSDDSVQHFGSNAAGKEHNNLLQQEAALSEKVQQYVGNLRLPGSIGADWGFQPAKTPTKQSGAQLPVSGASTPMASRLAPAGKDGTKGSPAWKAWPGGSSHPGTPVRQEPAAAAGGDTSRDPVCAPPPRHQPHVQSISRPLSSAAVSTAGSASAALEDADQAAGLLEKLASIWAEPT